MTESRLTALIAAWPHGRAELARRAAVAEERLQELEQHPSGGSMQELRALSRVLGVRPSDLLAASNEGDSKYEVLFRRTRAAEDSAADAAIPELARRMANISSTFGFVSRPPAISTNRPEMSLEAAERSAAAMRMRLGRSNVDPLIDLPRLCSSELGILVFVVGGLPVEGASAIADGNEFVFVAPRTHRPRMLFTLAHELGHLALRTQKEEFAAVDVDMEGSHRFSSGGAEEERFADAFASALLLPPVGLAVALQVFREKAGVAADAVGDVEILFVARIFGVSFEVAARRCESLDLLPPGGALSLVEHLNRNHKNPEQRAREVGLPPAPEIVFPVMPATLLQRTVDEVRSGRVSLGRAAQTLGLTVEQLVASQARA